MRDKDVTELIVDGSNSVLMYLAEKMLEGRQTELRPCVKAKFIKQPN
jgi:hypothetical protein